MSLVRYETNGLFDHFNNDLNRFFTSSRPTAAANDARNWAPAVDIREENDRFLLIADIPGVKREEVEVTLEDGVLSIKGERRTGTDEAREGFHRKERVHGSFLRQFTLPDTVNPDNISATVTDGVLEIGIPKQAKPEPRKISIN
ncbi:MAG: Hsp20/alpha crystallin family protein [Gammaproteobacteria bacterium]|nr:Hsp20/alpha crystallin family protein [Gammaproteobacteria bacterium]